MKSTSRLAYAAGAAAALALAGCANYYGPGHRAHHPQAGGPPGPAAGMMAGRPPMGAPMMDMQRMCDMHRHMMGAKTPEERRKLMEQGMPGMSPEMMKHHEEMMRERCK